MTVKFGKGASRRRAESFRRLERLTRSFSFVSNSGGMARMLSGDLLGTTIEAVYHTGIVVYGKEYWFGHGLQCAPATLTQTQFGAPMRVEKLGETEVDEETWESFMREVRGDYFYVQCDACDGRISVQKVERDDEYV